MTVQANIATRAARILMLISGAAGLAACQPDGNAQSGPAQGKFAAIAPDETIDLTGTEPFWGGRLSGAELVYTTPENPEGTVIHVTRFAGNGGLGYSGRLDGKTFDMAITTGACSDGMSERSYPFTATLQIGEEQRQGCAWTASKPFSGPRKP